MVAAVGDPSAELERRVLHTFVTSLLAAGVAVEAVMEPSGKVYGRGRWRKRKGIARIRLKHGGIHTAEVHWHEAHGIGRKEFKVKRILA